MPRKLVSQEQLINVINDALASGDALDGDCRECRVRGVYRLTERDAEGCNWDLGHYRGPPECAGIVAGVIRRLKHEYNLAP